MQENNKDAQNDKKKAVKAAIERIARGENETEEEVLADLDFLGTALKEEYDAREFSTKVKMPHLKGLKAADDFERFVKTNLKDELLHFHKSFDQLGDEVTYEAIVSRILVENLLTPNIVQEFAQILSEASGIDIGIETDNPKFSGNIYFDIAFPAIMRVK